MKSNFVVCRNFHKMFDLPECKFMVQVPLHWERVTNISGQMYVNMMVTFFRREREENGEIVCYIKDARGIRVAWVQRDVRYVRYYR